MSDAPHLRILRRDDAPGHLRARLDQALRESDLPPAWLVTDPQARAHAADIKWGSPRLD